MSRTYMRLTSLRIQRDYRKITLNYMQLHLFGCKSSVAILKIEIKDKRREIFAPFRAAYKR
ncbi:hypothetical protein VDIAB_100675 [Vibrio diabolicus]|nr:hypothetical protein VDIAB_100675 [Vibrio diabolicus]